MIQIRKSIDRGHADHGWLDAHHTFSFAGFVDPEWMGYSDLRVLNQDRIQPAAGFPTHSHDNMEIVTVVFEGILEHKDSMGNGSQILPGEVQYMAAGSGITHSEFNGSDTDWLELLQMWVLPREQGTTPRYGQRQFIDPAGGTQFVLTASPDGRDSSLEIGQDARLYLGKLEEGGEIRHTPWSGRNLWLHLARGHIIVNGIDMAAGDGAAIQDEAELLIRAGAASDFVLWELP